MRHWHSVADVVVAAGMALAEADTARVEVVGRSAVYRPVDLVGSKGRVKDQQLEEGVDIAGDRVCSHSLEGWARRNRMADTAGAAVERDCIVDTAVVAVLAFDEQQTLVGRPGSDHTCPPLATVCFASLPTSLPTYQLLKNIDPTATSDGLTLLGPLLLCIAMQLTADGVRLLI